jgi:hypothetical protein
MQNGKIMHPQYEIIAMHHDFYLPFLFSRYPLVDKEADCRVTCSLLEDVIGNAAKTNGNLIIKTVLKFTEKMFLSFHTFTPNPLFFIASSMAWLI